MLAKDEPQLKFNIKEIYVVPYILSYFALLFLNFILCLRIPYPSNNENWFFLYFVIGWVLVGFITNIMYDRKREITLSDEGLSIRSALAKKVRQDRIINFADVKMWEIEYYGKINVYLLLFVLNSGKKIKIRIREPWFNNDADSYKLKDAIRNAIRNFNSRNNEESKIRKYSDVFYNSWKGLALLIAFVTVGLSSLVGFFFVEQKLYGAMIIGILFAVIGVRVIQGRRSD